MGIPSESILKYFVYRGSSLFVITPGVPVLQVGYHLHTSDILAGASSATATATGGAGGAGGAGTPGGGGGGGAPVMYLL